MTEPAAAFSEDYYAEAYGDYDARNPERKNRAVLAEIRAEGGGGRLLDVGCAWGNFLRVAADAGGFQVWGRDPAAESIARAKDRLKGTGARLAVGALPDLGVPEGHFDVVCAFDVLEHVPDLDAGLRELRRALDPHGLLAIVVPVYDGLTGPIVRALDKDPTHLHKEGRGFWLQRVEAGGFEVVRWLGMLRYLLPGGPYLFAKTRRLRAHSPAVMILARRRR